MSHFLKKQIFLINITKRKSKYRFTGRCKASTERAPSILQAGSPPAAFQCELRAGHGNTWN